MADWSYMADWRYRARWDHIRASDADRDRVVELLREHCAAGRLTLDEMTERIDQGLRARTLGDLAQLMHDLPNPASAPVLFPKRELARPRPRHHMLRLAAVTLLFLMAASRLADAADGRAVGALMVVLFVLVTVGWLVRRAVHQVLRSTR